MPTEKRLMRASGKLKRARSLRFRWKTYGNNIFSSRPGTYTILKKSGNKKVIEKINSLLKDIQLTPYQGIGKPEPLKHNLSGYWSRRITGDHRLVYKVESDTITVIQLRFHYQ